MNRSIFQHKALRSKRALKLEGLESRTLLAGVEALALEPGAIDANVLFQSDFSEPESGGYLLKIAGSGAGDLAIDLNLLPQGTDRLDVSGFTSVVIVGLHPLRLVVASDIDVLSFVSPAADGGDSLSVPTIAALVATSVDEINFQGMKVPSLVYLRGDDVSVYSSSGFSSAYIFGSPDRLELLTGGVASALYLAITNPDAEISYDFDLAGNSSISGIDFAGRLEGVSSPLAQQPEDLGRLIQAFRLLSQAQDGFDGDASSALEIALLQLSARISEFSVPQNLLQVEGGFSSSQLFTDTSAVVRDEFPAVGLAVQGFRPVEVSDSVGSDSGFQVYLIQGDSLIVEGGSAKPIGAVERFETFSLPLLASGETVALSEFDQALPAPVDGMASLMSRSLTAGEVLREHVLSKITDEFTPGERPALIMESRTSGKSTLSREYSR